MISKNKKQKKLCKTLAFISVRSVYGIFGCYSG